MNIDYGAEYSELSYTALFETNENGERSISCDSNAQQNGDSLCSCDAKFAQKIVQTENHCDVRAILVKNHKLNLERNYAVRHGT